MFRWVSLVPQTVKNFPAMPKNQVWSLDQEDPLEKEMATHSSFLAWRIPRTEESSGLQSMGWQRVRHDWVTTISLHFSCSISFNYLVLTTYYFNMVKKPIVCIQFITLLVLRCHYQPIAVILSHICFPVAQLCPTLCDHMDWRMPGFSVFHHLLELAQTHVLWVGDAIQPTNPLSSPSPPAFNLSQYQDLF